jgi:predicted Zn-dependent protease
VQFAVTSQKAINAWAHDNTVSVTGTLVHFVESDDELAVILGHELAHLTEQHIGKQLATSVVATTVGATLAAATDLLVPGVGTVVLGYGSGVTQAAFTRGFEREADYRGLLYAYQAGYDVSAGIKIWERFGTELPGLVNFQLLSTHPSSPARMVHIRKISESLQTIGLDETVAMYDPQHPPHKADAP